LGAGVGDIVLLMSRDFSRLVLIAILIGSPIAWFVMNRWLGDFAFHIDIGWQIFALAALMAFGIAWITVGYQSVRASLTDPVKALRHE
jgi:putative ABC transport system permease protein